MAQSNIIVDLTGNGADVFVNAAVLTGTTLLIGLNNGSEFEVELSSLVDGKHLSSASLSAQNEIVLTMNDGQSFSINVSSLSDGKFLSSIAIDSSGNLVASMNDGSLIKAPMDGIKGKITSIQKSGNTLIYIDEDGIVTTIDLSEYQSSGSYIPLSERGQPQGVAELGTDGRVLSSQLPSYVDDVREYDSIASLPVNGEPSIIYVITSTNSIMRWSGTQYVEISSSGDVILGSTSTTAHRGDHGVEAYNHSTITSGNPHGLSVSDLVGGSQLLNDIAHNDLRVVNNDSRITSVNWRNAETNARTLRHSDRILVLENESVNHISSQELADTRYIKVNNIYKMTQSDYDDLIDIDPHTVYIII